MVNQNRRLFLSVSAAIITSLSTPLLGQIKPLQKKNKLDKGSFLHGVASGDPLQDKVIIWTRVTPETNLDAIRVIYEVSKDEDFQTLVRRDYVLALKENDYTIKIDLQELKSDTKYYYRFQSQNNSSPIAQTKTLAHNPEKVTFALFSCANYTNGYFNAYKDASNFNKFDAIIHLGDYIYEYGMFDKNNKPAYATKNAKKIGRELPKNNSQELLSLKDYRLRYALYRSDEDLQKLHAKYPFICIWDDHEVVNNSCANGSAKYLQRKSDAIQAYYEWLPIRAPFAGEKEKIFRAFHFGELLSLYMLDTRLFARDKTMEYKDYFNTKGEFEDERFLNDSSNPRRHLIGDIQFQWLENEMRNSKAYWQVIAQQVKLTPGNIPLEILQLTTLYEKATTAQEKKFLKDKIILAFNEISRIQARDLLKDPRLTQKELLKLKNYFPYNLDAWDGYLNDREQLYSLLQKYSKASLVLSGDAHYSWCNKIVDKSQKLLGFELGVTSVSSPGFEEDYELEDKNVLKQLENAIGVFDKNSLYNNLTDRGYMILEIDKSEVRSHWRYVDTIDSREYKVLQIRNKSIRITSSNGIYRYRIN